MHKTSLFKIVIAAACLLLVIVSCSKEADEAEPEDTSASPPPSIESFTANPMTVQPDSSSTLSWEVRDATSVSIDQGVGEVDPNSSVTVTPSASTTYTLTASNDVDTVDASVTVTVTTNPLAPVIESFTAVPPTIPSGDSSDLSWSVLRATEVVIDHGVGPVDSSGSIDVAPTASTTYTLTATNAEGSITAAATVTVTAAGPWTPIEATNQSLDGYNSDVFSWLDAAQKERTAAFTRNDAPDPGGSHGGILRRFSFDLPDGTNRVVTGTGANSWNGFGYLATHFGEGAGSWGDTSREHTGAYRTSFLGRHHAIHEFRWSYPLLGHTVVTTVHWFVATGKDYPVYAITYDTSAAGAGGYPSDRTIDSRSPYGDMAFTGDGTNPFVSGVAWGDKYKFSITDEPLTPQSGWDYSIPNSVPYAYSYVADPDAEMGLVQTLSWEQHNTGGSWLTDEWGRTSANPAGDFTPWVMPSNWQWPYQLNQYELSTNTDPTRSKRVAWGLMYGAVGQESYWGYGYEAEFNGHPYQSYSVYTVIGRHSVREVESQVTQVQRMLEAQLTVSDGEIVTEGIVGPGQTDPATYAKAGYNQVYGAFELTANQSGAFTCTLNAAGGDLSNPIFIVRGVSAIPTVVTLDGSALNPDEHYFASLDVATNTLWITIFAHWNGSRTLAVNPNFQ